MSLCGLPRPTLVLGFVYDILWFYDIKTYMFYVLKNVYVLWKGTLVVSSVVLPGVAREGLGQPKMYLKESYYPQTKLIL